MTFWLHNYICPPLPQARPHHFLRYLVWPIFPPPSLDPWIGCAVTLYMIHGQLLTFRYVAWIFFWDYVPIRLLRLFYRDIYSDITLSDYLYGGNTDISEMRLSGI